MANATHQWSGSPLINSTANRLSGESYRDRAFPDATFDTAVTDPPPNLAGFRVSWWSLQLTAAKSVYYFGCTDSDFDNAYAGLWYKDSGVWKTAIAPSTTTFSSTSNAINLKVGITYYVGVGFAVAKTSGTQLVSVFMQAPIVVVTTLAVPAIAVRAGLPTPGVTGGHAAPTNTLVVPPIGVRIAIGADGSAAGDGSGMPPLAVRVALPVPTLTGGTGPAPWTGTFDVVTPVDTAVVASSTPQFTVAVDVDGSDSYRVYFQFADNAQLTNATTASATFSAIDGGTVFTPSAPLPNTTYWTARLTTAAGVEVAPWLTTRTLTIATAAAAYALPVTWFVDPSAERPIHLWHIDPAGPNVNDTVTVYGQGFPTNPLDATLKWGSSALSVTRWERVDASDDNTDDATRLIDADTVTPEHYEVEFVAPKTGGALLTLEA